jgi:hypothetical protein
VCTNGQNMGRQPYAYHQSPAYQAHFPPLPMSVGGPPAQVQQQGQQQRQQQQLHMALPPVPAAGGFGGQRQALGPPACWSCQQAGHRSFECPLRNQRGPQAPQQPAVPGITPQVSDIDMGERATSADNMTESQAWRGVAEAQGKAGKCERQGQTSQLMVIDPVVCVAADDVCSEELEAIGRRRPANTKNGGNHGEPLCQHGGSLD